MLLLLLLLLLVVAGGHSPQVCRLRTALLQWRGSRVGHALSSLHIWRIGVRVLAAPATRTHHTTQPPHLLEEAQELCPVSSRGATCCLNGVCICCATPALPPVGEAA
jgi:hypothetical protein